MHKLEGDQSPNLIEILSTLRTKALRKGIWFQTLTHQERILAGLIRKHVKIVRNVVLATVIAKIVVKLINAIRNSFLDKIEKIGRPVAKIWSTSACAMGWNQAAKWIDDKEIVIWLGLTRYYNKGGSL